MINLIHNFISKYIELARVFFYKLPHRSFIVKAILALVTFALYTICFNWKFALLLMVSIGWHESGHIWAMRKVGLTTLGFYFIPFVGGVAISNGKARTLADSVIVFIMGPMWGMLLSFLTLLAFFVTKQPILAAAAYWQAFLNLFNLVPVNPFDGGQIFRAILFSINKILGRLFLLLSVLISAVLLVLLRSPIFLILIMLSVRDLLAYLDLGNVRGFLHSNSEEDDIVLLSKKNIILTTGCWIGLAGVLYTIMLISSSVPNSSLTATFFN